MNIYAIQLHPSSYQYLEVCLKTLCLFPLESSKILSSHHPIMTPNLTFPQSLPPPPNGDYIGTESCIDLENDNKFEFYGTSNSSAGGTGRRSVEEKSRNGRHNKEKKEFPPPIPLLARTQNLYPHMQWVLKRYCTNDGRLILKEEKVRHHEYFRAHRADGRLTLQLVPLDDDVCDTLLLNHDDYDLLQGTSPRETNLNHLSLDCFLDEQHNNDDVDEGSDSDMENKTDLVAVNGTMPNHLNCSRATSDSSCIFGVPVHAIS